MKTIAFYAVFGVVEGYHHDNLVDITNNGLESLELTPKTNIPIVSEAWQKAMQEEFEKTDIVVSAVMTESNTVYPVSFGCPKNGEKTVTVNGHFNPKFIKVDSALGVFESKELAIKEYFSAVVRVCEVVKKELKQTTVSLAFYDIDYFVYLTDKRV